MAILLVLQSKQPCTNFAENDNLVVLRANGPAVPEKPAVFSLLMYEESENSSLRKRIKDEGESQK